MFLIITYEKQYYANNIYRLDYMKLLSWIDNFISIKTRFS